MFLKEFSVNINKNIVNISIDKNSVNRTKSKMIEKKYFEKRKQQMILIIKILNIENIFNMIKLL